VTPGQKEPSSKDESIPVKLCIVALSGKWGDTVAEWGGGVAVGAGADKDGDRDSTGVDEGEPAIGPNDVHLKACVGDGT
jgi:hypothetical protein